MASINQSNDSEAAKSLCEEKLAEKKDFLAAGALKKRATPKPKEEKFAISTEKTRAKGAAADLHGEPDSSLLDYLTFTLSLPERAIRSTSGLLGGAIQESSSLLIPQIFKDSKTYSILVQQTLDFMIEDIARIKKEAQKKNGRDKSSNQESNNEKSHAQEQANPQSQSENFIARKTVGSFVDMASLATLHLSPMLLLAVVSDVAYGSQEYLQQLADELRREGVIQQDSTIHHVNDLLDAIGNSSSLAASTFDTPPISIEGLRDAISQTTDALTSMDPTTILPTGEIKQLWEEMQEIATEEELTLLEVSGAITLHSLDKIGKLGRGALSTVRVAGTLLDRVVMDHYRIALADLHEQGYYTTLANKSQPYIEAVWKNFSTEKNTLTQDLLSGKIVSEVSQTVSRWLGLGATNNQAATENRASEKK